MLVSRVADRVGKGVRTAPRDALLAAYASPETHGRVFGLHRALDTLGAALVHFSVTYLGFAAAGALLPATAATFGGLFALSGVAKAWLADVAPHDEARGRAMGLHAATTSLAALVASTSAGALWAGLGPAALFLVAAAGALVVATGLSRLNSATTASLR